MKNIMLLILVHGCLLLCSCKVAEEIDPKKTIAAFALAIASKDIRAARSYCTVESQPLLNMLETMLQKSSSTSGFAKLDLSKIEYGAAQQNGDDATVTITEKTTGQSYTLPLKKENGIWKIYLDINALMNYNMNLPGEMNSLDSISRRMENVENMNPDSLEQSLNDGLRQMDSMRQELKKLE